jgi:hypothetical protein
MGKTINNPNGAFDYTDLQTKGFQLTGNFKTSAAITGPAVVAIASDLTIATAPTDGTAALTIGVCPGSAASGDTVPVTLLGVAENVPVDGATAQGALLKRSTTTAGRLAASATPAAGEVVAVSLAASSSNATDVWVCPAKVLS